MAKIKINNYTFDKTAKTVTFTDYVSIRLDAILLIVDVASNIIIYNFADPLKGGTVLTNVLTLDFDTSAMNNADSLLVYYDDASVIQKTQEQTPLDLSILASKVNQLDDATAQKQDDLVEELKNSDQTMFGDSGPIQQHEKEYPNYPAREILTFDTNLHTILGSQNLLTPDGRLKVSDQAAIDNMVFGKMPSSLSEVILPLQGQGTVTVQLIGTWAGTITFYGSNDGQNWIALGGNPLSSSTIASTATANGIWRMGAMGLKYFKTGFSTYTSGICGALITSSPIPLGVGTQSTITAQGSVGTLSQKASTSELNTFDTNMNPNNALIKDALQFTDPWNPLQANYYIGDTCNYNGQNYICILAHSAVTAGQTPASTTYWLVDKRQNKSLVTNAYVSPPMAARVRVEIDMDGYQYRLAESQLINSQQQLQNDMVYQDYDLSLQQCGAGGVVGKQYAMGQSGQSVYNFTEIR